MVNMEDLKYPMHFISVCFHLVIYLLGSVAT